jgi:RNA polymerase sigma factor (sigma-70 family)
MPLLRHIRQVAFQLDAGELTDGQLLERFLSCREEAAFAALVRRHGPMVLGVCRRVLRCDHDAEDAFQATFLVLIRKAASILPRELVGHWLYGVAYRTALKARSMSARRRVVEGQVRDISPSQTLDTGAGDDVQARLDHELNRLPPKYRAPVILCELEGKSRREAARQLGVPEGTLSSRLARAKQLLARRLSGANGALSAGAVSIVLATQASSAAVPAALLASTVRVGAMVALGSAAGAVVSAKVVALTEGVIKAMLLTKLKTVMVVVVMAGMLALTIGVFGPASQADPGPAAVAEEDQPPRKELKTTKDKDKQKIETNKLVTEEKHTKAEEIVAKSFKTKGTPHLVVETFNGAIQVTAHPKGAVTVKVTKTVRAASEETAKEDLKNVDVQMSQDGDNVRIVAKSQGEQRLTNRAASVELQVPPNTRLELKTSNGKVSVLAPVSDATVRTSNGKIEIKGGKGKLDLKTSNGSITADSAAGKLELQTSNGSISIKSTQASVTAHTSNGAIHFSGGLANGEHNFHTTNGSIDLTLPANANFRVEAHTSHGKTTSQFELKTSEGGKRNNLKGAVSDNPAATIKLKTTNGNIDIRQEK